MNIMIIIALFVIIVLLIRYKGRLEATIQAYKDITTLERAYEDKVETLCKQHKQEIIKATTQALTSSRDAFKRELGELFCPFQQGFPYKVRDCIFIGNPIDYIIFNNLEAYREGQKEIDEIEIIFFRSQNNLLGKFI